MKVKKAKESVILKKHLLMPVIIILTGFLITLLAFFSLIASQPKSFFLNSLQFAHPWIILITGIFISLVAGLLLELWITAKKRKSVIRVLKREFEKEIANRLQTEDHHRKLEKGLLESQKLQAIGTLAGGIAHDFNNILYAIIGYVEMAREDTTPESITHKNLGSVLEAANRGKELVSRILAFSRKQHMEFIEISLNSTIEGVLMLLRPTIPASVNVKYDCNPEAKTSKILGNQTQLHQVIVNIINNAVDAMDGEGTINITLEKIDSHDPLLKQFQKEVNANYCKVDITDSGHGMDKNTIDRIFEPFFTTKEVGKGTGLGLSTAHTIMHEHNGEILVKSQLGHGTTFSLLFPEEKDR